jgi:tRNA/rRNA methyltransferase
MAGTDTSRKSPVNIPPAPVIILVGPQLGENIGMCARAMLNCAVTELRIVSPRDGWPNPAAISAASGAASILDGAKLYTSTKDAVADLSFVLATTARSRDMVKEVYTPEAAAREIRGRTGAEQKCGILFGPERTGLENDDVACANGILSIPLNPGFSSLNLAQAVLLVCFAWLSAENPFSPKEITMETGDAAPARKEEVETLLAHLEDELDKGKFFRSPAQKPTILRNIRNYFFRSAPTQQDIRTLHGIVSCLTGKRSWK